MLKISSQNQVKCSEIWPERNGDGNQKNFEAISSQAIEPLVYTEERTVGDAICMQPDYLDLKSD